MARREPRECVSVRECECVRVECAECVECVSGRPAVARREPREAPAAPGASLRPAANTLLFQAANCLLDPFKWLQNSLPHQSIGQGGRHYLDPRGKADWTWSRSSRSAKRTGAACQQTAVSYETGTPEPTRFCIKGRVGCPGTLVRRF